MEQFGVGDHLPPRGLARVRLRADVVFLVVVGVAAGLVRLELDRDHLIAPVLGPVCRGVARVIPRSIDFLPVCVNGEAVWPLSTFAEDEARNEIMSSDSLCLHRNIRYG